MMKTKPKIDESLLAFIEHQMYLLSDESKRGKEDDWEYYDYYDLWETMQ